MEVDRNVKLCLLLKPTHQGRGAKREAHNLTGKTQPNEWIFTAKVPMYMPNVRVQQKPS